MRGEIRIPSDIVFAVLCNLSNLDVFTMDTPKVHRIFLKIAHGKEFESIFDKNEFIFDESNAFYPRCEVITDGLNRAFANDLFWIKSGSNMVMIDQRQNIKDWSNLFSKEEMAKIKKIAKKLEELLKSDI